MIAALQAENAKMPATIRAHDLLIQTLRLRLRIAKLELALEDLLIASAESVATPAE